jgi:hypothetical protein
MFLEPGKEMFWELGEDKCSGNWGRSCSGVWGGSCSGVSGRSCSGVCLRRCSGWCYPCLQVNLSRQVQLLEQHLQALSNGDVPYAPSAAARKPSGTRYSVSSHIGSSRKQFHVRAKSKAVVQAIQESPCPWLGCFQLSTPCGPAWEELFLCRCLIQTVSFHWCLPLRSDWPVEY